MPKINVNGKEIEVRPGATVADLLLERELAPVRVAVEVNEELVPRRAYASTSLQPGDMIEIVTFVGGG